MKRIVSSALVVSVLTGMSLFAEDKQGVCSNQPLKGNYGVQIRGTRPAPSILPGIAALPGTTEDVIGVVIRTFDGNGNFTQTDNVKGSLSGITFDRTATGTYTLNSDCTGTATLNNPGVPFPIVSRFVVVNGGAEYFSVVVSPQAVMVFDHGIRMK